MLINISDDLFKKNIDLNLNIDDILKLESIINNNIGFFTHVIISSSNFFKKEIYLFLLLKILKKGLKVLIVVSSIFNLYTLKTHFDNILKITVDIYDSKLSESDKLSMWVKSKNKKPSIIITTKKGILLPIVKLGIIIVDEENDLSYKVLGKWKYNAKNLAIARAYKENIPIVLESSEPSLETLYNINKNKFKAIYISSTNKKNSSYKLFPLIIDIQNQRLKGLFSNTLIEQTINHLNRDNQVCFIINRLNHMFTVLQCIICFNVLKCRYCNQFFNFNISSEVLSCKYCFYVVNKPFTCKLCSSLRFKFVRYNIDLIKENIKDIFVGIPVFFLGNNRDFFSDKENANNIKLNYTNKCIIVGEDKSIKTYLFQKVTLIVFLCIDVFFYSSCFKSIEYFGQLYSSITKFFGEQQLNNIDVIIQTKIPDNIFLKELLEKGYINFSHKLLKIREKHNLPPFYCHVIVQAESKKNLDLVMFLVHYRNFLIKKSLNNNKLWTIGPYPVFFNGIYRKFYSKMLLVHPSRIFMKNLLNNTIQFSNKYLLNKSVNLTFDVDLI